MSSKVTAKLPLGAAFSVLLISLTLLAGCKQEAPVDNNSYTPPGYGASVGRFTDTVWKDDESGDTIRFGAEGKVTVPSSWKKPEGEIQINGFSIRGNLELDDFTYSGTDIYGKVIKVQVEDSEKLSEELSEEIASLLVGDRVKFATFDVPRTESIPTTDQYGSRMETIKDYYKMEVTIEDNYTSFFSSASFPFTMENKPTSGDAFVGTYYDVQGRKDIQINKDGTFVRFTNGGQSIQYWEYNGDGTISVQSTPFTDNPGSMGSSAAINPTIYYLYPHALMRDGSSNPEAYK